MKIPLNILEAVHNVDYLDISRVDFYNCYCIHINGGSLDVHAIKRIADISNFRSLRAMDTNILSIIFDKEPKREYPINQNKKKAET